eukprot:gene9863-6935_t
MHLLTVFRFTLFVLSETRGFKFRRKILFTSVEMTVSTLRLVFYVALNFVSSVGVVCINKIVFNHGFPYGTLLTVIHFIFTFLSLFLAVQLKIMRHKKLGLRQVIPLCATYSGFVALTNISLVFNPISISQLMKALNNPTVVVLEFLLHRKKYSPKILLSLALCVFGVTLTIKSDDRTTLTGVLIALSSTLVSSMNQIFVGSKQRDLNCSAMELLLYQAPISALFLVPTVPILDNNIFSTFTMPTAKMSSLIFASSVFAMGVNASIFLLIGTTSPVTYNVISQLKLVSKISMDFIFFSGKATFKILLGITITISSVFWYSQIKRQESNAQSEPTPSSRGTDSTGEEENWNTLKTEEDP